MRCASRRIPSRSLSVRDLVVETLEAAHYPVSDVEIEERAEDGVEIVATLVSTAIEPEEIEAVIGMLKSAPSVRHRAGPSALPIECAPLMLSRRSPKDGVRNRLRLDAPCGGS